MEIIARTLYSTNKKIKDYSQKRKEIVVDIYGVAS